MANEFKVKKGLIVDGTGTVLDVQGTQGQLFSVTDSLTGDLFSVSDISGVPIFNVNSSGAITADGDIYVGSDSIYDVGTSTVKFANIHADDFHGTFNGHLTGNAGSTSSIGNLTGHITSTNRATVLGSFTTAELNAAISDGSIPSGNVVIDWTTDQGSTNIHANNVSIAYDSLTGITTASTFAGTAGQADQWSTTRQLLLNGDVSGNVFWDGSGNVTLTCTVANDSHSHSNYIASDGSDSVNGDTTWQDGHYVALGDAGDFRIYHDGTNNHIRNYKHGVNSTLQSENQSGTLHTCVGWGGANSYANLYYSGVQKLITTANGITVSGSLHTTSTLGSGFAAGSLGQQMEPGDASVATLRCDANRWRVYMGANSGETLTVAETGRVGIKDSSPDYPLDVNGNVSNISIYASHDVAAYSDSRVKGDVKTIPDALDKVNKLRGVTFVRTDEGSSDKRMMGVIAQEVKDIIPEVVTARESDGHYSVSYGNMVGLLIESIKELTAEVESLKKKIDGGTK